MSEKRKLRIDYTDVEIASIIIPFFVYNNDYGLNLNRFDRVLDDDEAENIPISVDLKLKDTKCQEEERLLPIRTNPPTPQGFSATRDPSKSTPSKGPKSRLKVRVSVMHVIVVEICKIIKSFFDV